MRPSMMVVGDAVKSWGVVEWDLIMWGRPRECLNVVLSLVVSTSLSCTLFWYCVAHPQALESVCEEISGSQLQKREILSRLDLLLDAIPQLLFICAREKKKSQGNKALPECEFILRLNMIRAESWDSPEANVGIRFPNERRMKTFKVRMVVDVCWGEQDLLNRAVSPLLAPSFPHYLFTFISLCFWEDDTAEKQEHPVERLKENEQNSEAGDGISIASRVCCSRLWIS